MSQNRNSIGQKLVTVNTKVAAYFVSVLIQKGLKNQHTRTKERIEAMSQEPVQ